MTRQRRIDTDLSFDDLLLPVLSRPHGVLLESNGTVQAGADWCFAGIRPYIILQGDLENVEVYVPGRGDVIRRGTGFETLQQILDELPGETSSGPVPFDGGAVGFFGYGAGRAFESLPAESRRDLEFPHLYWAFYDEVLAYRRSSKTFWHVTSEIPPCVPEGGRDVSPVEELLDEASVIPSIEGHELEVDGERIVSNTGRSTFEAMVREAKSFIEAGDIYQVNLSRRFAVHDIRNPGAVYLRLRSANPAPYSGYIGARNFAVISSSPELFLRRRGSRITTRPIKGTRPRSADPSEDTANRQALLNSEKDLAELHMIVDLERNDLGRVCKYGTVRTDRLHELETFEHVHHLVGTVSGDLRSNVNVTDLLEATFPGGSVTGAPKIRAMEIIDRLEPTRRQVYTGSMGWIGHDGDLELNICIRTLEWKDQSLYFQVGGGIVADSDPAEEFQETKDKARGMMDALLGQDRE